MFSRSSGGNFALAHALHRPASVKGLILMEPALYAIYLPEEKPAEVERMQYSAMPLFRQGEVVKGFDEFIDAIFGNPDWPNDRPPLTEADLDRLRSFGHDQPVVISWCPSEAELRELTQPVLIVEGDQSRPLLRHICRLLDDQLANSQPITLKGQNHSAPWTAPELLAKKTAAFISDHER